MRIVVAVGHGTLIVGKSFVEHRESDCLVLDACHLRQNFNGAVDVESALPEKSVCVEPALPNVQERIRQRYCEYGSARKKEEGS
jgi:hypothetical protein